MKNLESKIDILNQNFTTFVEKMQLNQIKECAILDSLYKEVKALNNSIQQLIKEKDNADSQR